MKSLNGVGKPFLNHEHLIPMKVVVVVIVVVD